MTALDNRVISREHYERLLQISPGLVRLAKMKKWEVQDNPDPNDGRLVTLVTLALERAPTPEPTPQEPLSEPPAPALSAAQEEPPEELLPTLEQYVAAGYSAENYNAFIEQERARTNALRAKLAAPPNPDHQDDDWSDKQ